MNSKIKTAIAAIAIATATAFAAPANASSGYAGGYVYSNSVEVYYQTFAGGQEAYIELWGDGYSDIDLWVYDENGYLIAKSTGYGSNEAVSFFPRWTGTFKIVVENKNKPTGSGFELITY